MALCADRVGHMRGVRRGPPPSSSPLPPAAALRYMWARSWAVQTAPWSVRPPLQRHDDLRDASRNVKIEYKKPALETWTIAVNLVTGVVVIATFILQYGFDEIPLQLSVRTIHVVQTLAFLIFLGEKGLRFLNAFSKRAFFHDYWYEIPLLLFLIVVIFGAGRLFEVADRAHATTFALAVYLVVEVVVKVLRSVVKLAASGRNPMHSLILTFLVLIVCGAGLLMLPRARQCERMSFVDALFTSTSATCVTGLIVKDTGRDFSLGGQIVILALIQLGGLGIVVFGAVMALLLRQALSVRESVAMQDLLSAPTLGQIGRIIGFIFTTTLAVEAIGAAAMLGTWKNVPPSVPQAHAQWFCSLFHAVSAFCNAGFSLFSRSLMDYRDGWQPYAVFCPLIILGGLGFGVLYNLFEVACDRFRRWRAHRHQPLGRYEDTTPCKLQLQTKVVLTVSLVLILLGTAGLWVFESIETNTQGPPVGNAFFQSVTARTAGFNTVDIAAMSEAGKLLLIVLMFIGGSPGSTAGGIKTATLAVIVMAAFASLRKRPQVEMFRRTVPLVVVGRAITVSFLFALVLLTLTMALCVTERESDFRLLDILFEAASALGTVGLSTGITASLTTTGKLLIIVAMLVGRLGPLTLLAALTFDIKPAAYDYPAEPIIVG